MMMYTLTRLQTTFPKVRENGGGRHAELGRQKQKTGDFKVILGHILRPCLKK
jgi:hypothetical protein